MKNKPLRGFKHLIGETIKKIDAEAVNIVKIETESGKIILLDSDEQLIGIGIISCILVED